MPVRLVPLSAVPQRIAIIKPSALGDILNALPVLGALRRRFPQARLAWIINHGYASLLAPHPDLNEIITFDRSSLRSGIFSGSVAFVRFLRHLRRQRFDLAIDLQGLLRSGLMTLATRAPVRIGLATAREGARWCYTHRIDDITGVGHAVDRCWRVAEALDAADVQRFDLPIDAAARAWAAERLRDMPRPWIAVGAGAAGSPSAGRRSTSRHCCAAPRTNSAAPRSSSAPPTRRTCRARSPPVSPDRRAISRAGPACPSSPRCSPRWTCCVANDTGPLHLAVALGRPVVAPYTCTQVALNGPYGQFHRAVETTVWCKGSYRRRCDRLECMAELTPDRLWPHLHEVLAPWQSRCLPA